MLIYFHKNKFRHNKGQLAPFFILMLVAVIVMAMVTVNLSKVAFIKTDSSNAVDSGALAAGSVMANVFNAVASANSQMETLYWEFYAAVSISFVIAFYKLTAAYTSACLSPCTAVGNITWFIRTAWSIIISVTAYQIAQYYFYLSIRETAKKGREQAIKLGHRFAFINSGLGSKLKEGSPPAELTEQAQKNNYRNEFSRFLDNIGEAAEHTYPWEDGQEREHYVRVKTNIDPVDTFKLQVAVLPLPAELGLLGTSLYRAYAAKGALATACACSGPQAAACRAAACAAAKGSMFPIFFLMPVAWVGLLPGPIITDTNGDSALPFIISWIDDIAHNRLVRVESTQHHEGADLGLWGVSYPDTYSYSLVNFRGQGQIHPPALKHDPSIIQADTIGSGTPPIEEEEDAI